MKNIARVILLVALATIALAQSPEPPLTDARLTIHTLVREDIFAGFLQGDMVRFSRGEKNIQLLLDLRPAEKPDLLAWKGGAQLYRAIRSLDEKRKDEFQKNYDLALAKFDEARKLAPQGGGVNAVIGGSFGIFADQLPEENRAAAWSQAYDSYKVLWKQQEPVIDKLPVHLRGELLAGMAQSSQRTGRAQEADQYVDKIITLLPGTPYEKVAKQWKANPASASKTSMSCMTCHDQGRLADRLTALNKQ
jgi:tetratricopeptide (TPR) repeat protein